MKQFKKIALLCSLFLATITGCAHKKQVVQRTIHLDQHKNDNACGAQVQKTPQVTVWVHGTKFNPLINLLHGTEKPGMHKATTLPSHYRIGSTIKNLAASDPERFPLEHFYVFGWSGKLSFDAREQEAQVLFKALQKLVETYQKTHKCTPIVRIITHSHGGNLLLNMAKINDAHHTLKITQAILLACPVQHETKDYVSAQLFEQIYSIYSTRDLIQILDPQGLYLTEHNEHRQLKLSERTFPHATNMRQTELKINGHGIGHVGFVLSSFTSVLPSVIDEMESWQHEPKDNGHKMLLVTTS